MNVSLVAFLCVFVGAYLVNGDVVKKVDKVTDGAQQVDKEAIIEAVLEEINNIKEKEVGGATINDVDKQDMVNAIEQAIDKSVGKDKAEDESKMGGAIVNDVDKQDMVNAIKEAIKKSVGKDKTEDELKMDGDDVKKVDKVTDSAQQVDKETMAAVIEGALEEIKNMKEDEVDKAAVNKPATKAMADAIVDAIKKSVDTDIDSMADELEMDDAGKDDEADQDMADPAKEVKPVKEVFRVKQAWWRRRSSSRRRWLQTATEVASAALKVSRNCCARDYNSWCCIKGKK